VNREVAPTRSEVSQTSPVIVPKVIVKAPVLPSAKPEVDSESDEDLVLLVRDIAEQETVIQDDVEPSRQEEEVDNVDNSVVEEVVTSDNEEEPQSEDTDDVSDAEHSEDTDDTDEDNTVRRSSRVRNPTSVFTYDSVGGNPTVQAR